jgi:predicted deacylase
MNSASGTPQDLAAVKSQSHPLRLGSSELGHGRHLLRLPVTTDLDGAEIALYVHAVVGARPGPTLTLTSTLHGVEWLSIEMIRRVIERLDPDTLSGAVLGLPVVNPPALRSSSRTAPDNSDSPDLNRIFPGKHTWINDLIAKTVVEHVLPVTSALVDFHLGIWGSSFGYVAYGGDFPDPAVTEASRAMAQAFDFELVCQERLLGSFPGPNSLAGYAGAKLGIPSCIGELGGAGFSRSEEEAWIEATVTGLQNVMRSLGMLPGSNAKPRRHLYFENKVRVNPSVGGMLHPAQEEERLGREVKEGELLATVVSPYTFEVLEELRAPFDGYLAWIPRWYPVRPGDWAFGVIPKDDPTTRWVE